jgi:hypothetical protein
VQHLAVVLDGMVEAGTLVKQDDRYRLPDT